MKKGIDISAYQRNLNYDDVIKEIDFAILRVGYGIQYAPNSQRDGQLNNHYTGLKGKVPLGAYYFGYASTYDEGVKEAENCLSYIEDKQFELPIYYDLEVSNNTAACARGFIDKIHSAGLKAGIYASSSFYNNKGLASVNCDSVWIAQYGINNGQIPSKKPSMAYNIWQYTSVGRVSGINGKVDMNIAEEIEAEKPKEAFYSYTDFIKELQGAIGAKVDGIVGPETMSKLPVLSKNINRKNAAVKVVQKYLANLGYTEVGAADGIAGNKFDSAVKAFQSNHGLISDGIIGKNTWKKLLQV